MQRRGGEGDLESSLKMKVTALELRLMRVEAAMQKARAKEALPTWEKLTSRSINATLVGAYGEYRLTVKQRGFQRWKWALYCREEKLSEGEARACVSAKNHATRRLREVLST